MSMAFAHEFIGQNEKYESSVYRSFIKKGAKKDEIDMFEKVKKRYNLSGSFAVIRQ